MEHPNKSQVQSVQTKRKRGWTRGRDVGLYCMSILIIWLLHTFQFPRYDSWSYAPQSQSLSTPPPEARPGPPWTIPLVEKVSKTASLLEKAVFQRHQCLRHIRERHHDTLGSWIQKKPGSSRNILLVDPAYHSNVGDHMLTLAEHTFMEHLGWSRSMLLECNYIQAGALVPACKTHLKEYANTTDLALWHAGGNWGDLWRIAQTHRLESFVELLRQGYTVVGFPQSLYYESAETQQKDVEVMKENIANGLGIPIADVNTSEAVKNRMIFTWREKESFKLAEKLYPFVQNRLMPDIAFQLGPFQPIPTPSEKVDILIFLRNDKESKVTRRQFSVIRSLLDGLPNGKEITFRIVDWNDRLEIFDDTDTLFTGTSVQLLSLGKVVIADRLHASILSYLMGKPFVYLDQVSKKITKSLSVAFDSWEGCQDGNATMWAKAAGVPHALRIALDFLDRFEL